MKEMKNALLSTENFPLWAELSQETKPYHDNDIVAPHRVILERILHSKFFR